MRLAFSLVAALLLALAPPALAHGGFAVFYSATPDRSSPSQLEGARVSGPLYAFVVPDDGVASVRFHLDDPTMRRAPLRTESSAPYDLGGGSTTAARALDTSSLSDGAHTVTALVATTDGHEEIVQTGFVVGEGVAPTPTAAPTPTPTTAPTPSAPPAAPDARNPVRLNAGGPERVVGGVRWAGCQEPSCGGVVTGGYDHAEDDSLSGVVAPADEGLYRSEWTGGEKGLGAVPVGAPAFRFTIPVKDGDWLVRLHFAELNKTAVGQRVFDVDVEGGQGALRRFDVFAAAGGAGRALVREFPVTVRDGAVDVALVRQVENAKVSAIEVLPVGTTTAPAPTAPAPTPGPTASPTTAPPTPPPPMSAPPSTGGHELRVSDEADRSPSRALAGATVGAKAYVFVPDRSGIRTVRFWMGTTAAGAPLRTERYQPWDLAGGSSGAAVVFDTSALGAGSHSVTAVVTDGSGDHTVTSTFTVGLAPTPVPTPTSPAPPAPAPSALSWETRAPAQIIRSEAVGAAVGAKLYVFGGFHQGLKTTARSDAYDPASDTWSRLPDMPEEITHAPAVVVGETIWFFGGYVGDHPGGATRHVWRYDTRAAAWSRGPDLPAARGGSGAALLDGVIHVYGGTNRAAGTTKDLDQADHWALPVAGGSWQARAPLPNPRNHMSGAALGGRVYAIGGQHNENEVTGNQAQVDAYDPGTDRWARVADLPVARGHTTASAVVLSGRIVVMGGTEPGNTSSKAVTAYDPAANTWTTLPSLPAARKTPVAGVIDGAVLVSGGNHTSTTWRGTPTGGWERGSAMPVALGEVAGGVVGGRLVLVGEGDASTLSLDLAGGTWAAPSSLPPRPFPGNHHAAQVMGGRLYLFGGLGGGSAGKVQVFDPVSRSWSTRADMPFAAGSSSSALIGGKVYVAGGIVGSATTARTAVYDPAKDTWQELAAMPAGRNHAASGTDGSSLFVFGGRGRGSGDGNTVADGFADTQVYDPVRNTWRTSADPGSGLAALPQARGGTGAAPFLGGRFYVIGGETSTGAGATAAGVYDRVDVYDPAANRWTRGTAMPTARHGIFPVVWDGRLVVAGGGVKAANSKSTVVETYRP